MRVENGAHEGDDGGNGDNDQMNHHQMMCVRGLKLEMVPVVDFRSS